ncbi:MAG: FtsX-like permease family protein [Promethearchaeota archaeon]|jgi:ABC-type antimicrobial peptide transport system permease subunit
MTSFDFALKDFYRKKSQTFPYLIVITFVIAITEFLIYFTSSLGLNFFIEPSFSNEYFFSGSINTVYTQFNTLIQILFLLLAVFIVVTITTTLIINKKRDIGIMKALGTLPRRLYSFYLLEVYIIFFIGFFLGLISGLISFGIFNLIMNNFFITINFQIDMIFTPILFVSCLLCIYFISGYTLRKIGKEPIMKSFSKDIPVNYNASKKPQFIPKWLSSFGINVKMSIINTLRRKGEFRRYIVVFSLICLIIFTLGLGTIVLKTSSEEWIHKSQNENIMIFGHQDVISNYSLMYQMFSNPDILIDNNAINFTESKYLFNVSDVNEIKNLEGIEEFDERIIRFYDVQEQQGLHFFEDIEAFRQVGQNREATIPIIGVNPVNIIQNFEIEGKFFTNEDAYDNITIGDSLAFNLFDYALDQSLELSSYTTSFHISGVVIDSFYSGWVAYISINETRTILNLMNEEINLLVLKLAPGSYEEISSDLNNISVTLGDNFTHLRLDSAFEKNINFISNLSLYPMFLIIVIAVLAVLSLYNYQKGGIIEKARDFLIMRAIGAKNKSLKRILFFESLFVIVPSLLISLSIGMILNSIIIFGRVYLPPIYIPFTVFIIIFLILLLFNFLSLIPIMKKINRFSIKDFDVY